MNTSKQTRLKFVFPDRILPLISEQVEVFSTDVNSSVSQEGTNELKTQSTLSVSLFIFIENL